jgi:hypothetical protein
MYCMCDTMNKIVSYCVQSHGIKLDVLIKYKQQVKQGKWGKMSRGLDGHGPTRVQQHQRGYLLSFTPKTIVGSADNIIMDGLGCEHYPAVKFAQSASWSINLNVSLTTWELHSVSNAKVCCVPDTTSDHKLWLTDTGEIYQSPQASSVLDQAGLQTGQSDFGLM